MREEDGARYLSPLVKQDLAKLDTDGDTRRLAVKSLKLFVEQLDASTLPRFISQIAESREPGATRSYAISLYEEVARVHGKLVVPHIPKVMGALVRCSSASGSFPQLQVACARVTASLARYGIDSTTSQEEAEEVMRALCAPLIDALSGKLEPVAANAAACLHALAETANWKHVREATVHEVCDRTTVALSEKATRTAAHMHLIRILASVNPDVLSLHGASLLRAGEEILEVTSNSWQLRKAAAQMLQSVLTILDKESLASELNPALHALDSCRLDKMPHVRAAVSEALHTAKMLAAGNGATHTSFGMAASPIRSSWLHEDGVPVSSVTKWGTPMRSRTSAFSPRAASLSPRAASPSSQESRRLSFSPSSEYSLHVPSRKGGSRAKRAPLYPRSSGTPGTSPSSSTTTVEECESPSRRLNVREFEVRSQRAVVNGRVFPEEDEAGHGDNYLRSLASLSSDAYSLVQPTELDILGVKVQKLKEAQVTNLPHPEPMQDSSLTHNVTPSGEDSGLAQFMGGDEARSNSTGAHVEVVLPRLKLGSVDQHGVSSLEHDSLTPTLQAASVSSQTGLTNDPESSYGDRESANVDAEVEKHEIFTSRSESPQTPKTGLKHRYNALAIPCSSDSQKMTQSDFPSLVPPKRLVRSLSNLSIPEQGMKVISQDDQVLVPGRKSTVGDAGELDAETSSDAGWSVRDNPIASEESYRAESSDEEFGYEANFPKPSLNVGSTSPREIRMISPASKPARSFDDHEENDQQTFTSCRLRTPCPAVTSMQPPSGLPSLLHIDNSTKCEDLSNLCSSCACQTKSVEEKVPDPTKEAERGSEHCLVRMVSQNWKRICVCTETALGGSLCLVIALPLAMIVAKAVNCHGSRSEYHLVPT